jgi:hypothetical protein
MNTEFHPATLAVRFGRVRRHPELERLICAAICSTSFATLLLSNPEGALAQSEVGQRLSADERDMVLAVRHAANIYDYAGRLHALAHDSGAALSARAYLTPDECDVQIGSSAP